MKTNRKKLAGSLSIIFLTIALIISICAYESEVIEEASEQSAFDDLKNEIEANSTEQLNADGLNEENENSEPENALRFGAMISENEDFIGWIKIDGTKIDYPVMISPDDPDFYLSHDFNKEKSKSGTPYIGKNCDLGSDNIIIYGHNMRNGTMFSNLLLYAKESFFEEHPVISFDTTDKSNEYQVLAVFRDKVHYKDEKVFKYYNYTGTLSAEEFDEYITNVKAKSLYDTGVNASYGDRLITLSTCSFYTENGRFVVVAVKSDD